MEYICDGISQCPEKDDELFCTLDTECPYNCTCIGTYFNCIAANLVDLPGSNLHVIIANDNQIKMKVSSLLNHPHMTILALRSNNISILSFAFTDLAYLYELDLGDNNITGIEKQEFKGMHSLHNLYLDNNPISNLDRYSFADLHSLINLDLSNLMIKAIYFEIIAKHNLNLKRIDIRQNNIIIEKSVRRIPLTSKMEYMGCDSWELCCIFNLLEKCDAPPMPIFKMTDCYSLVKFQFARVSIWIFSISSLGLNLFAVVFHGSVLAKHRSPKNVLLLLVAASDSITASYIFALGLGNDMMQGLYVIHKQTWKEGCFALLFAQNFAMELSLSCLVLLSGLQACTILCGRPVSLEKILVVSLLTCAICFAMCIIPVVLMGEIEMDICVITSFHFKLMA